jgi:hypothetical protein
MTPQDVIDEVRQLVQDARVPFRYSDAVLVGFVNQTLQRMVLLRPDLFMDIDDIPVVANEVLQTCPPDSYRLVEIYRIKDGGALVEVSRDMLDQSYPDWTTESPDTPVNYVRHPRNPNKFFLYPRPRVNLTLVGEYVRVPQTYTLTQTIDLPNAYEPVLIDGVVYLAQSIDNEHVNSNRAKLFQDSFLQSLGVSLQSRTLTDNESGGVARQGGSS